MLKYSIALVPNALLWWITNSSDRFMVTAFLGAAANGVYAVAYKLPSLMSTVSTIFTQAWQFSAIKEDEAEDREQFNQKMYDAFFKFTFLISALLLLFLKPALKIYVSADFYEAWKYTPFLLLAFTLGAIATFIGVSYTVAKNNVGQMLSALTGALVNIILNFLLIPTIGINGASISTCASYFAVFVFRAVNTQKYVKLKVFSKLYIFIFFLFLLQIAAVYLETFWGYVLGAALVCIDIYLCRGVIRSLLHGMKSMVKNKRHTG